MNKKNVALVLMAIIGMMMLTWYQNEDEQVGESVKFLPALKQNLNNLGKLEVSTATGSFSLVKQDQKWVVLEKHSYPVDIAMLSSLLEGLSTAHLVERKTVKPENHSILEVSGLSIEGSKAKQVSGFGDGYSFSVLIGKSSQGREGQFVRKTDDSQVWLTDRSLPVNSSELAWLKPQIIDIKPGEVKKIEQFDLSRELQFTLDLVEGEDELVLRNLPANRRLRYPSSTSELAGALENLRLTDVRLHESDAWSHSFRTVFNLVDGREIIVLAVDVKDQKWLHLSVGEPAGSDAQSGFSAEDHHNPGRWDYRVAGYVFEEFTKNLDDLLDEQNEPAPE